TAGRRVLVFELDGAIFFGTAEKLAREIESEATADVAFVILDLRRVNELDGTGAAILAQTATRLRVEGRHLLLSHLEDNALAVNAVRDAGLPLTDETVFPDTDAALEWTENRLILQEGDAAPAAELTMDDIPVLAGLGADDKALIASRLRRADY